MTMSSPAANGSDSQSKNQNRINRRREWWSKNTDFKKKLRDRTSLNAKKENEGQTAAATTAIRVETSRGFRSSITSTKLASSKSKKPALLNRKKLSSSPQKSKPKYSATIKSQTDKKKLPPKAAPKTSATAASFLPPKPKVPEKAAVAEENLKPEMISEISMLAHGVDLSSGASHMPERYILFVGNLPYTVNKGQLMSHFRKTGGVKSVRIPKDKSGTPKGFAYLEFKDRISHGIALRLHHTTLGGRRINVEFSTSEAKKKGPGQPQAS